MKRIVWMASEYGRYGYRRITALLRTEGRRVNHKRVERIWRQEGMKVPARQPKRRRLWLGDGSCIRLRPTHRNHAWSYGFVMDRTADGRSLRMLAIVDEYSRECLAIDVARKMTSEDVLERLSDLFVRKGVPDHIRSDNGSEFTAKRVREWLDRVGVKTLYIEPGSPWENGYVESFNGKLRDELLAREVFDTLATHGFSVKGLGTLWSLYREQNNMHKAIVAASQKGDPRLAGLPRPFETIIPNATKIAEATDATKAMPASFAAQYTSPFAKLFESLCEEIAKRSEWSPPQQPEKSPLKPPTNLASR